MADPGYGQHGAQVPPLAPLPPAPLAFQSQTQIRPEVPVPPHTQHTLPRQVPQPFYYYPGQEPPRQPAPPQYPTQTPNTGRLLGFTFGPPYPRAPEQAPPFYGNQPSPYPPHRQLPGSYVWPGSAAPNPSHQMHNHHRLPGSPHPELTPTSNPPDCPLASEPPSGPPHPYLSGPLPPMIGLDNWTPMYSAGPGVSSPILPGPTLLGAGTSQDDRLRERARERERQGVSTPFDFPNRYPPMNRRNFGRSYGPSDLGNRDTRQDASPRPTPPTNGQNLRLNPMVSPRTSHRRTFTRFASDTPHDSSTAEADEREYVARASRRHREQRQREVRARFAFDGNYVSVSQMQKLRDKLRHFLPSELPEGTSSTCDICQKDYSTKHVEPTEDEEVAIQLPCGHYFGEDCINTWFETCKTHKNKITCPMCRKLLVEPGQSGSVQTNTALVEALMSLDRASAGTALPTGFMEILRDLRENGGVDLLLRD